jgi:hypothetical protein
MPVVYIATNRINGHKYIGASSISMEKRRKNHLFCAFKNGTVTCKAFHAAIRKYGAEVFEWTILSRHESPEEAFEAERTAIAEMKPEYNASKGGKNPFFGVPMTDERKAKIGLANRCRDMRPSQKASAEKRARDGVKPVVCLDDGRRFGGSTLAAAYYGLAKNRITTVCRTIEFSVKGHHFAYAEDVSRLGGVAECLRIRKAESLKRTAAARTKRRVCVMRLDDGFMFQSVGDAATAHGVTATAIIRICTGRGGGLEDGTAFAYAHAAPDNAARLRLLDERRAMRETARDRLAARHADFGQKARSVICVETGQAFPTVTAAAKSLQISQGNLSMVLAGKRPRAGGFTFRYVEASA